MVQLAATSLWSTKTTSITFTKVISSMRILMTGPRNTPSETTRVILQLAQEAMNAQVTTLPTSTDRAAIMRPFPTTGTLTTWSTATCITPTMAIATTTAR
jgi:hypothetical protein